MRLKVLHFFTQVSFHSMSHVVLRLLLSWFTLKFGDLATLSLF